MSSSECIIYEYVCKGSKILAESFSVLCFFCTITCIFKKNDFSVVHSVYCCFYCVVNNNRACNKFYFLSKKLRKTNCYRCKRKLRLRFSLRFSQVRAENDLSAVSNQFLNSRKSCHKTVFVCDLSLFQRHVKVASYQNLLAFYIDIINRFFI